MTSRLVTPWWRTRAAGPQDAGGGLAATPVLDLRSPAVGELVRASSTGMGPVADLRAAHALVARRVRPVYAVRERQPASVTLARGRGSCSQRLAVLEAVARALGVRTRSHGLLVDGRFWYPRFPGLRLAVPDVVVGRFDSRDELFDPHGETLCRPLRVLTDPVLSRWSAGAAPAAGG